MHRDDSTDSLDIASLEAINAQLEQAIEHANEQAVAAAIAHSELRQIFNAASDGIWVIDKSYRVVRINRVQQQLVGLDEGAALGRRCHEIFACGLHETPACSLRQVKQGCQRSATDIELKAEDGASNHFICTGTPYWDISGSLAGVVETFTDITERKQAEFALNNAIAELNRQAYYDSLTQLANRRMFVEYIEREWKRLGREGQPLSVVMCDIDNFKTYNDHYGHQAGDQCLAQVAAAIRGAVQRPADMVARYGGEEFIVMLPGTGSRGAQHVAERIRRAVRALGVPHEMSSCDSCVTISLGVSAAFPRTDRSWEALVQEADVALYEAKREGRNRVASSLLDETA